MCKVFFLSIQSIHSIEKWYYEIIYSLKVLVYYYQRDF